MKYFNILCLRNAMGKWGACRAKAYFKAYQGDALKFFHL